MKNLKDSWHVAVSDEPVADLGVSSPMIPPSKQKKPTRSHIVEYLLVAALIGVVSIAVLIQMGRNVTSVFSSVNSKLQVWQRR